MSGSTYWLQDPRGKSLGQVKADSILDLGRKARDFSPCWASAETDVWWRVWSDGSVSGHSTSLEKKEAQRWLRDGDSRDALDKEGMQSGY